MQIRIMRDEDLEEVLAIWNEVVEEGCSFPFEDPFTKEQLQSFLSQQTLNKAAVNDQQEVVGMYTLHPNLPGRCSTIANATYLVKKEYRHQHIGFALVNDSLLEAERLGFRMMQFNGVVDSNIHARSLYRRCGFTEAGVIPKGFCVKDGSYQDMHIMYRFLTNENR